MADNSLARLINGSIDIYLDIDECEEQLDNCDDNAQCTNNPGNFTCACKAGFSGSGVVCVGKFS